MGEFFATYMPDPLLLLIVLAVGSPFCILIVGFAWDEWKNRRLQRHPERMTLGEYTELNERRGERPDR